ncbi:hypothetical protein ICNMLN_ICNMLN_06205, partial [Dysosmobacter welbionis]
RSALPAWRCSDDPGRSGAPAPGGPRRIRPTPRRECPVPGCGCLPVPRPDPGSGALRSYPVGHCRPGSHPPPVCFWRCWRPCPSPQR